MVGSKVIVGEAFIYVQHHFGQGFEEFGVQEAIVVPVEEKNSQVTNNLLKII